ncbi:hypothetical protein SODALDRAFT_100055 [Sodiomyces alkalinus F11]|uniref:Uncharacterized protein n=1 Tax=Sodiomyces alkalinus (strain CBS 110278 / VKM F-3762 / F11) TaxID=1314773 RepID=A0A3N2Q1K4_SODAK|nr:hypothetical protein SODALDRAFT_100055 [Sodiomyces alkalinus F11]ROT40586.1 hypothetical protein SODALDRAFT_100055 [Sodiomyces alkalinus F11]
MAFLSPWLSFSFNPSLGPHPIFFLSLSSFVPGSGSLCVFFCSSGFVKSLVVFRFLRSPSFSACLCSESDVMSMRDAFSQAYTTWLFLVSQCCAPLSACLGDKPGDPEPRLNPCRLWLPNETPIPVILRGHKCHDIAPAADIPPF